MGISGFQCISFGQMWHTCAALRQPLLSRQIRQPPQTAGKFVGTNNYMHGMASGHFYAHIFVCNIMLQWQLSWTFLAVSFHCAVGLIVSLSLLDSIVLRCMRTCPFRSHRHHNHHHHHLHHRHHHRNSKHMPSFGAIFGHRSTLGRPCGPKAFSTLCTNHFSTNAWHYIINIIDINYGQRIHRGPCSRVCCENFFVSKFWKRSHGRCLGRTLRIPFRWDWLTY